MSFISTLLNMFRSAPVYELETQSDYRAEVVGESHYQNELLELMGGYSRSGYYCETRALLRAEPNNPHDQNAVAVFIRGKKVGYLPRKSAAVFRQRLPHVEQAICGALITGGWRTNQYDFGYFGIRLNYTLPRLAPADGANA